MTHLDVLRQTAVLWRATGYDEYGQVKIGSAEEIKTRWEIGKGEIRSPDESPIDVDAEVWVENEVEVGSLLWRGKKADLPASPSPLYQVVDYVEIPDLKGVSFERRLMVKRFKEELPS